MLLKGQIVRAGCSRHDLRTALYGTFPSNAFSRAVLYCLLDAFLRILRKFRDFDVSCGIQDEDLRAEFKAGFAVRTTA